MVDFDTVFQSARKPVVVALPVFAVNFLQQAELVQQSLNGSHDPIVLSSNNHERGCLKNVSYLDMRTNSLSK